MLHDPSAQSTPSAPAPARPDAYATALRRLFAALDAGTTTHPPR